MRALFLLAPLAIACGGSDSTPLVDGSTGDGSMNGGDGSMNGGDGSMNGNDGGADGSMNGNDGSMNGGDGGGTLKISCGPNVTCMASQTCCVSQGGQTMYTCVNGACPMGQTALKCAKTTDCSMGQVCCAHIDMMNNVTSQCLQACPNTPNDAQLCSNMDMPTGCMMGVMCSSNNIGDWNLPNGFATCGGKPN